MRTVLLIAMGLHLAVVANTQTLGGSAVYNFLQLPNTPQLTGLGGINISNQSNDVGLAFNNPALLRPALHAQMNLVFNSFYAGTTSYQVSGAYCYEPWQTTFALGIHYFNYGDLPQTDPSGNVLGQFRAADYVIQLMAGRRYLERWYYGATFKLIQSAYGPYHSVGLAMDAGVSYLDSANGWQGSLLMNNMGAQLTSYTGAGTGDLPFDVQLGISKRLAKAPLQFSLTLHHLYQFDIRYNDPLFDDGSGASTRNKSFTIDKLFRHIVLATQAYITDKIELSLGYNYLLRKELNIGNSGNGFNGFSMGVGVLFKKMQLRYARSYHQQNTAYNQLGLNLCLNQK